MADTTEVALAPLTKDYQRLEHKVDALAVTVAANYDEGTKIMESFADLLKTNGENSLELCDAIKLMNENMAKESLAMITLRKRVNVLAKRQVSLDSRLLKHAQVIHMNQLKTPDHGGEL